VHGVHIGRDMPAVAASTECAIVAAVRAAVARPLIAYHNGRVLQIQARRTWHTAAAGGCWQATRHRWPDAAAAPVLGCKPQQTLCALQHTETCSPALQHERIRSRSLPFLRQLGRFCCSLGSVVRSMRATLLCTRTDLPALAACSCNSAAAISKAALKTSMCCNSMSNISASNASGAA
jgi:hypothetical protein